jgi:hypothetical protein
LSQAQPKAAATSKGLVLASSAISEVSVISPSIIAWALSQILAKTTCENDDSCKHILEIFESQHPYAPSSGDIAEVIDLPFARSIIVTFDSKCFTENSEDVLTFFTDETCQPHSIAKAKGSSRELRFS